MKNGKAIGREHAATLESFLQSGVSLPQGRDGSINLTELSRLSGIPKSSFYQNPAIRSRIASLEPSVNDEKNEAPELVSGKQSIAALPDRENKKTKALERRVHLLEQQNAALVAENAEMRRQMKALRTQLGREDMTIETGRRFPAPPPDDV